MALVVLLHDVVDLVIGSWPEQLSFGENLSYTPWHALPEHLPVGQINAIRKAVYLASSALRHQTNHVAPAEPTGNEY
jgi:hypothetical protein